MLSPKGSEALAENTAVPLSELHRIALVLLVLERVRDGTEGVERQHKYNITRHDVWLIKCWERTDDAECCVCARC